MEKAKKDIWSQDYSLTVTLLPKLYKMKAELQLEETKEAIRKILQGHRCSIIGELTKNFNIHYHVCLSILKERIKYCKNVPKYISDLFRGSPYFGYVCVKVVTDYDGWKTYMTKSLKETHDSLNANPIVYDEYRMTDHVQLIF